MTETEVQASTAPAKATGLSAMLLPELKQLAQQMGISGASGMRKGDLVAAIGERQRSASLGVRRLRAPAPRVAP